MFYLPNIWEKGRTTVQSMERRLCLSDVEAVANERIPRVYPVKIKNINNVDKSLQTDYAIKKLKLKKLHTFLTLSPEYGFRDILT